MFSFNKTSKYLIFAAVLFLREINELGKRNSSMYWCEVFSKLHPVENNNQLRLFLQVDATKNLQSLTVTYFSFAFVDVMTFLKLFKNFYLIRKFSLVMNRLNVHSASWVWNTSIMFSQPIWRKFCHWLWSCVSWKTHT